jgi:hypothetical protein
MERDLAVVMSGILDKPGMSMEKPPGKH